MINIEALDKIIAVVVVILILSLFVQSLQALLKKMFKIKSLQIETSLVHLFYYMLNGNALAVVSSKLNNSPILRMIMPGSKHPADADPKVKALYDAVTEEFRKAGRVTTTGKMMLDSISKDDLMKFVGRIQSSALVEKLAPGLIADIGTVQQKIATIDASVQTIKTQYADVLSAARVQFDQIEPLIRPFVEDVRQIYAGGNVSGDTLLADFANLKNIKLEQVVTIQAQIAQAITQLQSVQNAKPAIDLLQAINDALNGLAAVVKGVGSIKNLLGRLATWYDTVMQGFEERYARSMKTWAWIISALVVIFLNANLVRIYKDIATSDAKREVILQAANQYKGAIKPPAGAQAPNSDNLSPEEWYKEAKTVIDENTEAYTSLGFAGPTWIKTVGNYVKGNSPLTGWQTVKEVINTLFGWFVMTLLLSAGAPFWQDALESLFGIKNFLRGSSGTKNVEQQSGAGQPKP